MSDAPTSVEPDDPTPTPPLPSSSIRSPSPRKATSSAYLGLGVASAPTTPSVATLFPHLTHYITNLLQSIQTSPNLHVAQHPLSVSSSGESDGSDSDGDHGVAVGQRTPQVGTAPKEIAAVDRDGLVRKIVELLDNEEEEAVKDLLRPKMGELAKDEILMDQVCLDCMHRRKDDMDHIPYSSSAHLTPTRARASPSIVSHPLRPYTPTRVPSFRSRTPLGRSHSPSPALPSQTPHHPSSLGLRAEASPTLAAGVVGPASSSGYSSAGSPISSPRMLSAKAISFNPSPRPGSAILQSSSSSAVRFSPSDPWKDVADPPRSASPFGAISAPGMTRTSSNLAIAAPLLSNHNSPFHSPIGTPNKGYIKMPEVYSAERPSSRGILPDDDEDDEFSPFGSTLPKLHHHSQVTSPLLNTSAKPFEPFGSNDQYYSSSDPSSSFESRSDSLIQAQAQELSADELSQVSSGMTPLDVLCSVFTTVPPSELEDALHRAGYDFEGAMAILVSQHAGMRSGSSTPQRVSSPRPGLLGVGSRGAMPINAHAPSQGYFQQGGRALSGTMSPGGMGARSPGPQQIGGTRMCRYYLAGECRRSDCRFSHDIDRALCRFWLRGHCAKGPNCEFLHHLPNNMDPHALSSSLNRMDITSEGSSRPSTPPVSYQPPDEFPDLLAARLSRSSGRFDPSRNRFANAVKRATPAPVPLASLNVTGQARYTSSTYTEPDSKTPAVPSARPVPRPSQRIKLRAPTLLPTLKTGSISNEQYLSTRASAIRLGHARNACLARAADAFRRGDGAAAKRFSREGKTLNEKMLNEAAEAAQQLVRERRREAQIAIRERDLSWSDDPGDRSARGKECAAGLGVVMGIAGKKSVAGGEGLSSEERTEVMLDLHTLHGGEGADILGQFLAELERESFRGLAYVIVGEEKHVGTQDPLRGTSKIRLGTTVRQALADWGYPWSESGGVLCIDASRF
ncbi:hypothetical protein P7C73_g739, partial [Tremellales sp. Uapishka_1]